MSGLAALVLVVAAAAVVAPAPAGAAPVPEARSAPGFVDPNAPVPVVGRARLSGRVLVYGSRDVVFGARILGATADLATATDAEGRFELWLPPGEHSLVIRGAGFRDLPVKVTLVDGQDLVYEYRLAPDLDGNPYRTVVRQQREVAISSTNLRDDEIHALPGTFGDPFRVVKSLPGASQLAGFLPYVVVRGAAPGNTGYFLDGVRVPILFHVAIGPSVIHPYFIDQVDFYPGGAPVRLGRYVSGMIEGRTRSARRDRVYGEFDIRITDAGGLVEVPLNRRRDAACRQKKRGLDRKDAAKVDCRRGPARGALTLAGRYSYTAGVLTLVQANAKIKFWDYQARFDHKLGQNAQYTAFAYGSFDSIGDKISPDPFLQFEFYRVQQRVKQQLPRGGTANYSLALGLDRSGLGVIKTGEWTVAPRIDVRLPLGERSNGEFGFGIDQEFQIFRAEASSGGINTVENLGVLLSDRFVSATGLYAELLWRKGPVDIRPGVRADIYAQIGPSPVLPQATAITHAFGVDPRLLIRQTVSERWVLRQNFGLYHQPPSFPVPIPGVESFGFERGLQRNLQGSFGYEFTIPDKVILTQDAYIGRLDNLQDYDLAAATQSQSQVSEFDDLIIKARGLVYGLETMLRLAPRQRVYGWAAYTLSRSTRTFDLGGRAPSNWDQRHILNIVLGYRIGEKWNLGGRLHYNSGRPYTAASADQSVADALTFNRNNKRLPSFFQLDLRLERTWRFRTWNLQATLDVLNATYAREVFACVLSGTGGMTPGFGGMASGSGGSVNTTGCTQQGLRYILPSIGIRGVF